ncbi:MAG: hypothetical protein L0I62_09620 [Gammaproteobacteria bacterium]|nr:hypothetical protein [Gammaproteobacteria bacterium]
MTPASARPSEPVQPPQETRGAGFTTRGTWFGPAERPLAGWWTVPDRPSCDGVIIAPPLGYEYWSAHRSLRTLGETLARAGWNVLRFDWDGSGDSAGEASDPDRVAAWRASLAHAVGAMREASMERVALIGLRLGATLALLDAAAFGIDEVVACRRPGRHRPGNDRAAGGIAQLDRGALRIRMQQAGCGAACRSAPCRSARMPADARHAGEADR